MKKEILRKYLLDKRLSYTNINTKNKQIAQHAICFLEKYQQKYQQDTYVITVYQSVNNEISLALLWEYCWIHNIVVLSPRVISNIEMVFCPFLSLKDLKKGHFGVLEPTTIPYEDHIDIMFIPGLSFDRSKARLGYGAGFYDRFLMKHKVSCTVGICDERLLCDQLPTEIHDQSMDFVITDQGMY